MISAIMPVYNTEDYLLETSINSIMIQSYSNFELIIINDGSNEKCSKKLDELAQLDKRIRLYHRKNEGVSASRNFAIEKAIGKFVTFIDSDDLINRYFFEEAIKLINKYNLEMIIGKHKKIYNVKECDILYKSDSSKINLVYGKNIEKVQAALLTKNVNEFPNGVSGMQCCKIYELSKVKNIKIPTNMKVSEDQIWNLIVMDNIKSVGICDNLWYYYLQHENSASHTYGISDLTTHYPYWDELFQFIKNKSKIKKEFNQYYYSKMINEYYTILLNYNEANYKYHDIKKNMNIINSIEYFNLAFKNINIKKCTNKEKIIIFLKKLNLLNLMLRLFVKTRRFIRNK